MLGLNKLKKFFISIGFHVIVISHPKYSSGEPFASLCHLPGRDLNSISIAHEPLCVCILPGSFLRMGAFYFKLEI